MSHTGYRIDIYLTVADSERWTAAQAAEFEDDPDRVKAELHCRLEEAMGGLTAGLPLVCPPDIW